MTDSAANRFNLVDEKWIPVANHGLASLADIFSHSDFSALGGNPIQKIALTKLLLAIAQAAYTPKDDDDWKMMGAQGMAEKALSYLQEKRACFWLYGEKPFLQMPAIAQAATIPFGAVSASVATGNTTLLFQTQHERALTDGEKALLVVELGSFALGGKKTDNRVVLTSGYTNKCNDKGRPATAKPGPSTGFMGFLHTFLVGSSLMDSLWLNLLTIEQVISAPHLTHGVGIAPWEGMPHGEDCSKARELKTTYLGRLVPLSRFALLTEAGLHYSEGILYPGYAEGGFDLSAAFDFFATKPRALWVDPGRRPWRQLTSLLAFLANERKNSFDCYQLRLCLPRARAVAHSVGVFSGGLRVSSNAGEQYASGTDDFVESEFLLESSWLDENWFLKLKTEMAIVEELAKHVYGCTMAYFKQQLTEGKDRSSQATTVFWQLAERHFQPLINACGTNTSEALRPVFARDALKAYDAHCPRDTARQLDAWAACRPQLGLYLTPNTTLHPSTHS